MKKRVLVFCDFYLPSYKSGGGMWTVVNLVDRFSDRFDFFIVTRNYDSKGDTKPYTTVETDEWNQHGGATVYYFSNRNFTVRKFGELVNEVNPDILFLNSALCPLSIKLLLARRRRLFNEIPVILAPCGELSTRAMSLKPLKKKAFLRYARLIDLYRDVIWKASSEVETGEILDEMGRDCEVFVAADLTPRHILPDYSQDWKPVKKPGSVRFAFVARLVRVKNIHYFLELLRKIKKGSVHLDFIGPLEDKSYWQQCKQIIEELPPNITVDVTGPFSQEDVLRKLSKSHFFVSPTLNENFGYIFIEAMAAGCPVLTSDRTEWTDIGRRDIGWRVPLEEPAEWKAKINKCIDMDADEYRTMSISARRYAEEWLALTDAETANELVLKRALAGTSAFANNVA